MDELLKKAQRFMEGNPGINEIELRDADGNLVKLIRNPPTINPIWTGTPLWCTYTSP